MAIVRQGSTIAASNRAGAPVMDSSKVRPARPSHPRAILRAASIVAAPAVLLLATVGGFDLAATRVDEYSRHQLGWRYESPHAMQD